MGLVKNFKLLGVDVLSALLTVDGADSKLDSDMVDGKHYDDILRTVSLKITVNADEIIWGKE